MARALFITGAGTEIGKTLVGCALAHQLRRRGEQVRVLKPVISGLDEAPQEDSDTGLLLTANGQPVTGQTIAAASPWRFGPPISPNMAATRAGRPIDPDAVIAFCRQHVAGDGITLIEGVGGIMAPITDTVTVLDWIAALGLPALVVTGSYLGAISHTLTAVAVLEGRGLDCAGVVVSESEHLPVPLTETVACIAGLLPGRKVMALPRLPPQPRRWEEALDLTALVPS